MASQQKIVVFGATSGMGLQSAVDLAKLGFQVYGTGRDIKKIAQVKESHPEIDFHAVDSSSSASLEQLFKKVGIAHHIVIALGGSKGAGAIKDISVDDIIEGFQAKTFNHLRTMKVSLPHLDQSGSITFISGVAAQMADRGTAGLAGINGAIEAMIRPLAAELAPIRVNAVTPGLIDTPFWNFLSREQREAIFDQYAKASLVGRVGTAEHISQTISFIIKNTFMTGEVITCDGGLRLKASASK